MRSKEAKALKRFANTYLTRRVLFFNEQVAFALTHELDTKSMIHGVCHDEPIRESYNNSSTGDGCCCLPKDTKELFGKQRSLAASTDPGDCIVEN